MHTHYVSFRKATIRVEFAIPHRLAATRMEARTIATKEIRFLKGYRYQGVN